jgi:hypothetical protein
MLRNFLIAILLATAATQVRADSYSCQQAGLDACKGKGPTCCEPPPCMYKYQLTMYRMLVELFADPAIVACGGTDIAAYVNRLARKPAFQNALPRCPTTYEGKELNFPPELATHRSGSKPTSPCKVFQVDTATNTETDSDPSRAAKKSTTCTELIDVNFKHEAYHMDRCKAVGAADFPSSNQTSVALDEAAGYFISTYETDQLLRHWNARCTPTKDRKKALKDATDGIAALKRSVPRGRCP